MQLMQQISRLEPAAMPTVPTNAWPPTGYSLNVALLYQDALTRDWAEQVREFMAYMLGEEALHCTEWNINELRRPATFWDGVQALTKADIIVVAIQEAERLPAQFYLWVNLWLQQRSRRSGALVGLVGTSGESTAASHETRRYLHALASQGHLDLILKQCDPSSGPVSVPGEELRHWAKSAA
jgi:hypothetical protein